MLTYTPLRSVIFSPQAEGNEKHRMLETRNKIDGTTQLMP